jgi:VWFA-related protein
MPSMRTFVRVLSAGALAACGVLILSLDAARVSAQAREFSMYVSVLDKDGKPVMDLRPDEFVIRENGTRREILRASRATRPLDIALIVDNSQASTDFITDLREAVRRFVTTMAGANTIALIGAAERPTVLQDYTRDRAALDKGKGLVLALTVSGDNVLH